MASPVTPERAASIYLVDVGFRDAEALAADLAAGRRGKRVNLGTRKVDGRTCLRVGFAAFNTLEEVDASVDAVVANN